MSAHPRHDAPTDGASQRVRLLSQFIESSIARLRETRGHRSSDGLVFMGVWHDSIPRPLIVDSLLAPVDKVVWQIIRIHASADGGASFPTYEAFQRCNAGARATIARALAILRLTRWISLCSRVRDARSRFRGNVYAIHEEPATVADAILLDSGYMQFLLESRSHGHPQVRNVADAVLATLEDRVVAGDDITQAPDLAERTLERIAAMRAVRARRAATASRTERGATTSRLPSAGKVSKTELPAAPQTLSAPGSKTERGGNPDEKGANDRVQKLNCLMKNNENHEVDSTVQKLNEDDPSCCSSSFIKTTTTKTRAPMRTRESSETELPPESPARSPSSTGAADDALRDLRFPPQLSANELALVRLYAHKATGEQRPYLQDLLFELQGRLQAARAGTGKPIPNPIGYFVGMMARLEDGAFALSSYGLAAREFWANQDRLQRSEAHHDARLRQAVTTDAAGVTMNAADPVTRRLERARAHWTARKSKKDPTENLQ